MIDLNDIKLVPKTEFIIELSNTMRGSVEPYVCSELTFKSALIGKALRVINAQKEVQYYKDLVLESKEKQDDLKICSPEFITEQNIKSRYQSVVDNNIDYLNITKSEFNHYLNQIDQDKSEYVTLMMFDYSEWVFKK